MAQLEEGTYVKTDKTTFEQWSKDWVDGYLVGIKETTKKNYESHLRTHINKYFGKKPIQLIEKKDVQKFCTLLYIEKKLSAKSIKNIHGTFHKCLDDAIGTAIIRLNPATGVILPKRTKPELKPLSETEIDMFLKAATGDFYEHMYKFYLLTGLRTKEATGLTFDRINFKKQTMFIDRQLVKNNPILFGSPKHDKIRTVSLPKSALDIIKKQKLQQAEFKMLLGDKNYNLEGFVFTADNGKPVNGFTAYKHLKVIAAKIGIPELRLHDLRHTYAVLSLQAGIDIKTVQENLGHHSAAFTLDQYGFVTDGMRQSAAEKLEKYVNSYVK